MNAVDLLNDMKRRRSRSHFFFPLCAVRAAAVRATAAMKAKDAPPLTRPDKNIIQNLNYIIDVVQNLDYVYFTAAGRGIWPSSIRSGK